MPLKQPSRAHELSAEEAAIFHRLDPTRMPEHVAVIMDGNGRWAGRRSMKRFLGHKQGAESVQFVVEAASRINLPWLTLYAFSLENNLRRPRFEVAFLMRLLSNYLLWQIAYTEIFVTERLWPDFRGEHLLEAIEAYGTRNRRFGGLTEPEGGSDALNGKVLVPR